MHISGFQVSNYKSFLEPRNIVLKPGFNIIVGKNNAGKTALIEALSLNFGNVVHRSLETLPKSSSSPENGTSKCFVEFSMSSDEVNDYLKPFGSFRIPFGSGSLHSGEDFSGYEPAAAFEKLKEIIASETKVICEFHGGTSDCIAGYFRDYGNCQGNEIVLSYNSKKDELLLAERGGMSPDGANFGKRLGNFLKSKIYMFKAERLNIGEHKIYDTKILESNSSNLPAVLHYLIASNSFRFERFKELVKSIFPDITDITVPPNSGSNAQIKIWTVDPRTERDDLAVSLSECGTGVGQVLAILYIIVTSDEPKTIIIDEPQSFLHPGAIRKLFEVLKDNSKHQFIITTHSPSVVSIAEPETLHLVRKEQSESIVEQIDSSESQNLQRFLSEVGARLSDIFGADQILWVEGATEEKCFPLIIRKKLKKSLMGTEILGVKNTGDFEKRKHPEIILEIYKRLSQGKSLLPPAVGFIFDKEQRDSKEIQRFLEKFQESNRKKIRFLKRTMYENYLLNPGAIAYVINDHIQAEQQPVSREQVQDWLRGEQGDQSSDWLQNTHGGNMLKKLFEHFSENQLEFRKVEHGVALTNWILENSPDDLKEVAELLESLLQFS